MATDKTRVRSVRADSVAWEVLEWWCSIVDLPVGSVLRQVIEEAAAEIAEVHVEGIDEDMPDGVLLKRARRWLNMRDPSEHRHPPE